MGSILQDTQRNRVWKHGQSVRYFYTVWLSSCRCSINSYACALKGKGEFTILSKPAASRPTYSHLLSIYVAPNEWESEWIIIYLPLLRCGIWVPRDDVANTAVQNDKSQPERSESQLFQRYPWPSGLCFSIPCCERPAILPFSFACSVIDHELWTHPKLLADGVMPSLPLERQSRDVEKSTVVIIIGVGGLLPLHG